MRYKDVRVNEISPEIVWGDEYNVSFIISDTDEMINILDEMRIANGLKNKANDPNTETNYIFYLDANFQNREVKIIGVVRDEFDGDDWAEYELPITQEEREYLFEYAKQIIINEREWEDNYLLSEYNEVEYYIHNYDCGVNGHPLGYAIDKNTNEVTMLKTIMMIARSGYPALYDILDDWVLVRGEELFKAGCSAEFITDDDCYLVWFEEV